MDIVVTIDRSGHVRSGENYYTNPKRVERYLADQWRLAEMNGVGPSRILLCSPADCSFAAKAPHEVLSPMDVIRMGFAGGYRTILLGMCSDGTKARGVAISNPKQIDAANNAPVEMTVEKLIGRPAREGVEHHALRVGDLKPIAFGTFTGAEAGELKRAMADQRSPDAARVIVQPEVGYECVYMVFESLASIGVAELYVDAR